jgi:hypothetical protein
VKMEGQNGRMSVTNPILRTSCGKAAARKRSGKPSKVGK